MYNGLQVPLKRCEPCRNYFKEWRKAPGSKAKVTEARHEATTNRVKKKRKSTSTWKLSDRGSQMSSAAREARYDDHLQYQRDWSKTEKGVAKNKRMMKKKYAKKKSNPSLWLKEVIRLKVGSVMRLHHFKDYGFSNQLQEVTEFVSEDDLLDHFRSQYSTGMHDENHGKEVNSWTIGHEIPQCYFNSGNYDDLKRCWKKANLFPQWWNENLKQGIKLPSDDRIVELINAGCCPSILNNQVPSPDERMRLEHLARKGHLFK